MKYIPTPECRMACSSGLRSFCGLCAPVGAPAAIISEAKVRGELGQRPSNPTKRQTWDRGVAQIEGYRQRHGVKDPSKAFGLEFS